MKEAKIIRANGTEEVIVPANGTDFSLKEAQKVVGGLSFAITSAPFLLNYRSVMTGARMYPSLNPLIQ